MERRITVIGFALLIAFCIALAHPLVGTAAAEQSKGSAVCVLKVTGMT